MKKTISLALFAVVTTVSAVGTADKCYFPEVARLDKGSEISTFVYDFWLYSKANLKKDFKDFSFIADANGPVVGDFHFNNVGAYFNDSKNKPDLAIIDMDDSGTGNQFADFIKLLLYIKSEFKESRLTEHLVKYYVKGLEDKTGDLVPEKLVKELADLVHILTKKGKNDFDKWNAEFVAKKIDGEKFKKSWGLLNIKELEKSKDPIKQSHASDEKIGRKTVEKIGKILDDGYRINESGSSIGAYRFVYLVKTKDGNKIVELKENNCAGSSMYVTQEMDQVTRLESNKKDLMSEDYWKASKVLALGHASYLLRIKKENPIEGLKKDGKLLKDYGAFYAYTLGRIHSGRSTKANANYVNGLEKNKEKKEFIKAVDDYVEAYDKSLGSRTKK